MNYQEKLNKPQISSARASEAADIDMVTLKSWLSREPATILLDRNERSPGERPTFALQVSTVYQIAIVAALVKLGIPPRQASHWAWHFTEVDDNDTGRPSCLLFKKDFTYLAGDRRMDKPSILNVTKKMSAFQLLALTDSGDPVVLLNLNGIIERVNRALGFAGIIEKMNVGPV